DATIRLNGAAMTFDADSGKYRGDPPFAGANTLEIDLPGHPVETIDVNVPAPIALTTQVPSSARTGSKLTFGWTDDPAVEAYSRGTRSSTDNETLFNALLDTASVTTDPINHTGEATVSIAGVGPVAVGPNGGFVTPVSFLGASIDFTP